MSYPPQAPSPPRVRRRDADLDTWTESIYHGPPYPLDDDELSIQFKELQLSPEEPTRRSRSRVQASEPRPRNRHKSSYRPLNVREPTDGGTESALVPSPRRSWERRRPVPESASSTEEERHVTFQVPEADDRWYPEMSPAWIPKSDWKM
jgi:hypothetical protein